MRVAWWPSSSKSTERSERLRNSKNARETINHRTMKCKKMEGKISFIRDLVWQNLNRSYRSSVSYQFARYALALKYDLLPPEVIQQAKRCVLDGLGCAIGGYIAPGRPICESVVEELGGLAEATIFCSGFRTSAINATLVNAFLLRFLDYNDCGGGNHNSEALPALLAVSEREKRCGQDFLTALVVSYEIGSRVIDSVPGGPTGWGEKGWTADRRGGLNMPPAIGLLMRSEERRVGEEGRS